MPKRPMHPCGYPGCPELTDKRYCEVHTKKVNSDYEKYKRDRSTKKKYDRAWKRIRDIYGKEHPYCERCFANGRMVEMNHVHHKIPINEGGSHDVDNLMSLCKSCHSSIHAMRGDYWG